MLGVAIAQVQADRIETVRRFCLEYRVHLVLKGARSVLGAPDGRVFASHPRAIRAWPRRKRRRPHRHDWRVPRSPIPFRWSRSRRAATSTGWPATSPPPTAVRRRSWPATSSSPFPPRSLLSAVRIVLRSADETRALGEQLGRAPRQGDVVACIGALGAGKTCLLQGLAHGLGVETDVTSPTFVLVNEYEGRLRVYHVDAYRTTASPSWSTWAWRRCSTGKA